MASTYNEKKTHRFYQEEITNWNALGPKSRGRPRQKWRDEIEADLRSETKKHGKNNSHSKNTQKNIMDRPQVMKVRSLKIILQEPKLQIFFFLKVCNVQLLFRKTVHH